MLTRIIWSNILLGVLFYSCKDGLKSKESFKNAFIIGHGGNGFSTWMATLPINTIESLRTAIEKNNADGIEMDIQLSSDNKLILFHDELLEKSTNCKGKLNSLASEEIKRCIYSSFSFSDYPIASLEMVIDYFSKYPNPPFLTLDLKLYPQTKHENYVTDFAEAISQMASRYSDPDKILIESTSTEMLQQLKSINPSLRLFIYPSNFESGFTSAQQLGLYGITIRHNLISKEQIEMAHESGLAVALWGTKSKQSNREALEKGPDFIQTDNIKNLTSLLN